MGSDLSKRQSRIYCDFALVQPISHDDSHFLVEFGIKESRHIPPIGFAGRMSDDRSMLKLEHVYFQPEEATLVSDGWCRFFFDAKKVLTGVMCGAKVDETGRRTTAIVAFDTRSKASEN